MGKYIPSLKQYILFVVTLNAATVILGSFVAALLLSIGVNFILSCFMYISMAATFRLLFGVFLGVYAIYCFINSLLWYQRQLKYQDKVIEGLKKVETLQVGGEDA